MISSEEGIRLAKRVAADQNCSRREAEALIVAGGVQVVVARGAQSPVEREAAKFRRAIETQVA